MFLRTIQKLFLITTFALVSNANALVINFDDLLNQGHGTVISNGYTPTESGVL